MTLRRRPLLLFEGTSIGIRATVAGARGEPSSYNITLFDDAQQRIILSSKLPGKFRRGMARLDPGKMVIVGIFRGNERAFLSFLEEKRFCRLLGKIENAEAAVNTFTEATTYDCDFVDEKGERVNLSSENPGPFRKAFMAATCEAGDEDFSLEVWQRKMT